MFGIKKSLILSLFCVALTFSLWSEPLQNSEASRPIPEPNYIKFVQFPIPEHPEWEFPDGIVIGSDGKLYVGFFGNIFLPPTETYFKGIGRVSGDGSVELVVELPSPGGIVEEMIFDPNGDLYVCVANYSKPDGTRYNDELINGIIKVDVGNKTFTQFYGNFDLEFPNGIERDCAGNFYLSDSVGGKVYKIDPNGNGEIWLEGELFEGTGDWNPNDQVGGPQGMAIDQKRQLLYVQNYDKGILIRVPINKDGTPGEPVVLIQDDDLRGLDTIGISPDYKTLFLTMLFSGKIAMVDLRNPEKLNLHFLADGTEGLGDGMIKTIPAVGFENSWFENGLFVTETGLSRGESGTIYFFQPKCPGNSKCTFYKGPMRLLPPGHCPLEQ